MLLPPERQPVPASHQLAFHKLGMSLGRENYIIQMKKWGLTENTPFALKFFLPSGQARTLSPDIPSANTSQGQSPKPKMLSCLPFACATCDHTDLESKRPSKHHHLDLMGQGPRLRRKRSPVGWGDWGRGS